MSAWRASLRAQVGALRIEAELGAEGGVLALVGPNGSGKTTLLRVLAGAYLAERAEIEVGGRAIESSDRNIRLPMEERRVGYVPQGYGLFPHLSVLENVAFGLSVGPAKLDKGARKERALSMLEELGCRGLADRRVGGLSGGEQQQIALARALAPSPSLLLLDEPLAALDRATRRSVRGFLAEHLKARGCPTLLVTHEARDVEAFGAADLGAEVCVLEGGRITQRGPLEALREDPASDFVAEFVGI